MGCDGRSSIITSYFLACGTKRRSVLYHQDLNLNNQGKSSKGGSLIACVAASHQHTFVESHFIDYCGSCHGSCMILYFRARLCFLVHLLVFMVLDYIVQLIMSKCRRNFQSQNYNYLRRYRASNVPLSQLKLGACLHLLDSSGTGAAATQGLLKTFKRYIIFCIQFISDTCT